jgi:CO/xanthine dehydrogenase FAD-binding subunit
MITEYHRPSTIDEAIKLLARSGLVTIPLAGGTVVNRPSMESFAVVDLQNLGLNSIHLDGKSLEIGAMASLQSILDDGHVPQALDTAIRQETSFNLRQVASMAGTLIAADGRSSLATALLAMDAQAILEPGGEPMGLGELLLTRHEWLPGKLVTKISIPMSIQFAFESIGRSPADLPLICVAVAKWPSGRTRIVLGGWGKLPVLAMDGPESAGAEAAARNACSDAGDEWASAEYRREMAAVLVARCVEKLERSE